MKLFLSFNSLPEIPKRNSEIYPDRICRKYRSGNGFASVTWKEFYSDIQALSAGFASYGLKKGIHAGFFSDNRYEWSVTDYALMSTGAVSVPRGSDTSPIEQAFLFTHSDSEFLIMEKASYLLEFLEELPKKESSKIKKIFLMEGVTEGLPREITAKTIMYSELLEEGKRLLAEKPGLYHEMIDAITPESLATIIYTSGTSGNPKGVMLTHANFMHNVRVITPLLQADPEAGETTVSILPSWHVYERCFEYCCAASAMLLVYSSIQNLAADLLSEKPTLMSSVPRIWESLHQKILAKVEKGGPAKKTIFSFFLAVAALYLKTTNVTKGHVLSMKKNALILSPAAKAAAYILLLLLYPLHLLSKKIFKPITSNLGGKLRASFSGGGSLPNNVDIFFNAIGIKLVNAFGMTETSPGSITRRLDRNTLGTIGIPLPETQVKIVKDNGWPAGYGERGIIWVKGPQVMKGYYKNEDTTKAIMEEGGWLCTGDVGILTASGDMVISGRSKSTIVLLGGENLEPETIEEKLKESAIIEQAVVLGQDKKSLHAIVTLKEERLKHLMEKWKISFDELVHKGSEIITHSKILEEIKNDIHRLISRKNGFKPFERISKFIAINRKFTIGEEMTQTLKVKRTKIEENFRNFFTGGKHTK